MSDNRDELTLLNFAEAAGLPRHSKRIMLPKVQREARRRCAKSLFENESSGKNSQPRRPKPCHKTPEAVSPLHRHESVFFSRTLFFLVAENFQTLNKPAARFAGPDRRVGKLF